jgi:hypothetical protein
MFHHLLARERQRDLLPGKHNMLGTIRAVATWKCRDGDGDGSSESAGTTAAEVSQGCGAP